MRIAGAYSASVTRGWGGVQGGLADTLCVAGARSAAATRGRGQLVNNNNQEWEQQSTQVEFPEIVSSITFP